MQSAVSGSLAAIIENSIIFVNAAGQETPGGGEICLVEGFVLSAVAILGQKQVMWPCIAKFVGDKDVRAGNLAHLIAIRVNVAPWADLFLDKLLGLDAGCCSCRFLGESGSHDKLELGRD